MTKDGCSQVNEEMEKLLGISYKNIANTVYIRQKEVDSLATADATELRKLITKLFGLDEFDSFKDKLTDRASSLQDEIDPLREKVGGLYSQREELNLKISIMASKQTELDTMTQEINNSRSMLEKLPKEEVVNQIEEIQKKVEQHDANLKELKIKVENLNRRIEEAQKRRTSSQVTIKQLVEDEDKNRAEINKLPLRRIIQDLTEKKSKLETYEEQIRAVKIPVQEGLSEQFDPVKNPEKISSLLDELTRKVEPLQTEKDQLHAKIEQMITSIASKKARKEFYEKSLDQIHQASLCPICSKALDDKTSIEAKIGEEVKLNQTDETDLGVKIKEVQNEYSAKERSLLSLHDQVKVLEMVKPLIDELVSSKQSVQEILKNLGHEDEATLLAQFDLRNIGEMMEKRIALEQKITKSPELLEQARLAETDETKQLALMYEELKPLETSYDLLQTTLKEQKDGLNTILTSFGIDNIDAMLGKFEVSNISSLREKRARLDESISSKQTQLKRDNDEFEKIGQDITVRRDKIAAIEKEEGKLQEKEKEIRHVKFLKGEIDGFVAGYIVERRLFGSLKAVANEYLSRFTNGRYTLDKLFTTSRRGKDRQAYGLGITLLDNIDGIPKDREDLSGGDETALGLALRLAISRLMARIRPYRTSQQPIPLIGSLIMDEPLSSLDIPRRQMVMKTLVGDQSFKQIFLVTHSEVEVEGAHKIRISQDDLGVRTIAYEE